MNEDRSSRKLTGRLCCGLCIGFLFWSAAPLAATSEEYVRQARGHLEKGELNAAVIQFKNALSKDPDNAAARFHLGETYIALLQGRDAEKELRRAWNLGFDTQQILAPLARAYLLQGKYQLVIDQIEPSNDAPDRIRAEVLAFKGQAELSLRRIPEAKKKFMQVTLLDADNVPARLGLARVAMAENNYDSALEQVEHVIARAPNEVDAWFVKGEMARLRGNFEEAKDALARAVKIAPHNISVRLSKAVVQIGLKEYDGASRDLDVVVRRFPQHPVANHLRALLAFEKKDLTEAESLLQRVQQVAPDYLPSTILLAQTLYGQGKFERALPHTERFVRALPDDASSRKLLGAIYLQIGKIHDAIETLQANEAQAARDAQWLALLGSAYLRAGDYDRATEWLDKAVEMAPDLTGLRNQLAVSYLYRGETAQAITELETAVNLGEGFVRSDLLLVLAHIRNQDADRALTVAQNLVEDLPEDPLRHNLLGMVYLAKEDTAAAREQFEQALNLAPGYSSAAMNLARLDLQAEKIDEAESRMRGILENNDRHVGAMLGLSEVANRRGRRDEEVRWVERAWEKNPGDLNAGLVLTQYYNSLNEHGNVARVARELRLAHPGNVNVLRTLGSAEVENGDYLGAIESFRKAAELQAELPEAHWLLANAQAAAKRYDDAVLSLNRALALEPDYLLAQFTLGQVRQRMNQPQQALRIARQIQEQRPTAADGYLLEGDIHAGEGSYTEAAQSYAAGFARQQISGLAIKLFRARRQSGNLDAAREPLTQWVKEHPDDLIVRQLLGESYVEGGKTKEAIAQLEVVVQGQPDNVATLNNLAWLLHAENDLRAIDYAQRAYDLAPNNGGVADTLGWVLLDRDLDRGLELLRQAASVAPHIPGIRYHLAVALVKNSRDDDARKELERLLRDHQDFPEVNDARSLLARLQD